MIISASAFALTSQPAHDYDQVLGASLKLANACVTESEVQSINAVRVCTNLEARTVGSNAETGIFTEWVCTAYETQDLAYPRAFERTVCLKHAPVTEASSGECLKFGKKADFLPKTIKIMTTIMNGESTTQRFGTHTFPACH